MTRRPVAILATLLRPRLLLRALPCVAAALLACACDRAISPALPAASDAHAAGKQAPKAKPAANASAKPASAPTGLAPPAHPPSDAQITARVAAAMRDDPGLAGADLSVHTDHGVVSVTGTVRSPEQVAEAEARAQAPTGVMRVDTRLSMAPQ